MTLFTLMARKMSSFFIEKGIIQNEEQEIYDYSFEVFFSTVTEFLFIIITAFATDRMVETMFYVLGFIPMRRVAGGYHAKTHFRCFCILALTYFLFLVVLSFANTINVFFVLSLLLLVNLTVFFILAPIEDKNRPISKEERYSFKKKSRVFVVLYSISAVFLFLVSLETCAFCMTLGVFAVASSLLAVKMKKFLTVCES